MTAYPSGLTKLIKIQRGANTPWWELTRVHVDDTVRIAGSHEAILQQEALVVMGSIVDEGLMVALYPSNTCDFITSCHVVETCCNLKKNKSPLLEANCDLHLVHDSPCSSLPARQVGDWAGLGREPKRKHPVHTGSCLLGVTWRRNACWRCTKPTWRRHNQSSAHFNNGTVSFQWSSMLCLCLNFCWCWPQCFVGQHLPHRLTHDRL